MVKRYLRAAKSWFIFILFLFCIFISLIKIILLLIVHIVSFAPLKYFVHRKVRKFNVLMKNFLSCYHKTNQHRRTQVESKCDVSQTWILFSVNIKTIFSGQSVCAQTYYWTDLFNVSPSLWYNIEHENLSNWWITM